jgi:hypothetical protein
MNHSAAHQDAVAENFLSEANFTKGMNTTNREREIDGTAALGRSGARVWPFLVDFDSPPRAAEVTGQEGAGKTGAYDRDGSKAVGRRLTCQG